MNSEKTHQQSKKGIGGGLPPDATIGDVRASFLSVCNTYLPLEQCKATTTTTTTTTTSNTNNNDKNDSNSIISDITSSTIARLLIVV